MCIFTTFQGLRVGGEGGLLCITIFASALQSTEVKVFVYRCSRNCSVSWSNVTVYSPFVICPFQNRARHLVAPAQMIRARLCLDKYMPWACILDTRTASEFGEDSDPIKRLVRREMATDNVAWGFFLKGVYYIACSTLILECLYAVMSERASGLGERESLCLLLNARASSLLSRWI